MLINNNSMVVILIIDAVTAGITPLRKIGMFEVGGSRQNNIAEIGLALPVAVLHDHKLQIGALVHLDPAIGICHGADKGAAMAINHLDRCAIGSRFRTGKAIETAAQRVAAETFTDPAYRRIHNDLRKQVDDKFSE